MKKYFFIALCFFMFVISICRATPVLAAEIYKGTEIELDEMVTVNPGKVYGGTLYFTPDESGYYIFYSDNRIFTGFSSGGDGSCFGAIFDENNKKLVSGRGKDINFKLEVYMTAGKRYTLKTDFVEGNHLAEYDVCVRKKTPCDDGKHKLVRREGQAATCMVGGWLPYDECTLCDYSTKKIYSSGGHKNKRVINHATETKDGSILDECTVCGEKRYLTVMIYKVSQISLSDSVYIYNGKVQRPTVTVKDSHGYALAKEDYTVTVPISKDVGTYTVNVTLKGNYSGTKKLTYRIVSDEIDINDKGEEVLSEKEKNCPKCGVELTQNAAFCHGCGEPMGTHKSVVTTKPVVETTKENGVADNPAISSTKAPNTDIDTKKTLSNTTIIISVIIAAAGLCVLILGIIICKKVIIERKRKRTEDEK